MTATATLAKRRIQVSPFAAGWCVCLVLLEIFGSHFIRSANIDLRSFYTAGYLLRTHPAEMYSLSHQLQIQRALTTGSDFLPFYHPAYEALLYAPLSMLGYHTAYFCYVVINLALLALVFRVARPEFSYLIPIWQPRPGLLLLVFLPAIIAVVVGQNSILFLLLLCMAWRQLESDHDEAAGMLMALALFKFQIVIPIVVLLSLRRGRKLLIGFIPAAITVVLTCLCIVGPAGVLDYLHALSGATSGVDASQMRALGVVPLYMPNLFGLIYACGGRFIASDSAFNLLTELCALLLLAACALKIRKLEDRDAFTVAVLCAMLISYHMYIYDLTLALLPVALIANRVPKYLLGVMVGLPILLLYCGTAWFFLMSLPVLAMLLYQLTKAYATCSELAVDTII